jgi:hypothetical protein
MKLDALAEMQKVLQLFGDRFVCLCCRSQACYNNNLSYSIACKVIVNESLNVMPAKDPNEHIKEINAHVNYVTWENGKLRSTLSS